MESASDNRPATLSAPIFVVGNVHSGTTLLQKILASHPDVYAGHGETQFYPNLALIRSHFPDLGSTGVRRNYLAYLIQLLSRNFNEAESAFHENRLDSILEVPGNPRILQLAESALCGERSHQRMYFEVFDIVASCKGAVRWLEKTPAHVFYIDEISQQRPQSRIIELIRDPRAVLASKRSRSREEWLGNFDANRAIHAAGGYDPVLRSLAWKSGYRQAARAKLRYPGRILTIRYEDLVQDPQDTIRSVCDFVELEYRRDMLQVHVTNSSSQRAGNRIGFSTEAISHWRTQLPESAILICDRIARREIKDGGYDFYHAQHKLSYLALPFIVLRSMWELCRIAWKRWRLRGTPYLMDLGRSYLKRLHNMSGTPPK
jgi:hypothetical protein